MPRAKKVAKVDRCWAVYTNRGGLVYCSLSHTRSLALLRARESYGDDWLKYRGQGYTVARVTVRKEG